jgi:hypothetical protein
VLTRKFYLLAFIFLFLTACDKPDSTPELRDPIYNDLKSEEAKKQRELDSKIKELEKIENSQAGLLDTEAQKKLNRRDIFRLKNEIEKLRQLKEYYRVSAESRQIYVRKQYLDYYKAGKSSEWPPADLKERYEARKRLAEAPKQWTRGIASKETPKNLEKKQGH